MSNFTTKPYVTPAIGSSFRNWMRSVGRYPRTGVPFKLRFRTFVVSALVFFLAPSRWYEAWRLRRKMAEVRLNESPVFIIGHWRSGTTHIHNLMAEDPQFGYLTHYACMFPHTCMTSPLLRVVLKPFIPRTRPMDKVALSLSSPQEEDLALFNITPYSFFTAWNFPKRLVEYFDKFVRVDHATPAVKEEWRQSYDFVLKKATLMADGKRLVLKNPPNTARVRSIMEMFPNAKFIHIHRNPLDVFYSTVHLHRRIRPQFQIEPGGDEVDRENVLKVYELLMRDYLDARKDIPAGNLVEVRYEDLDKNPIPEMERVYKSLGLNGFETAKPCFEKYLGSVKNFEKNKFSMSEEDKENVKRRWGFVFEEYGY